MDRTNFYYILVLCCTSPMICEIISQRCRADVYSTYQMMPKGHTFNRLKFTQPRSIADKPAPVKDIKGQSSDVIISKSIC